MTDAWRAAGFQTKRLPPYSRLQAFNDGYFKAVVLVCQLLMSNHLGSWLHRSNHLENRLCKSSQLGRSTTQFAIICPKWLQKSSCLHGQLQPMQSTKQTFAHEQLICGLHVHPIARGIHGLDREGLHLIDTLPMDIYAPHFPFYPNKKSYMLGVCGFYTLFWPTW